MAPKTKTNTAHNQLQTDIKDEAVLQAVLLADPFGVEQSWGPLAMQDDDEGDAEGLPWPSQPVMCNFDYQTVRPDFIHGILTSDLFGKTILCEVVKESHNLGPGVSWATLVGDVKSYDRTSKDILARRSQPFVLDQARLGGPPPFSQRRGMVYMDEDVDLAPDCKIGNSTCLGHGCTISRAAEVRQAYIGRSSQVGPSSQVTSSYIFDGVTIGPNATIKHSIIGSNVCIKADCVIDEDGLVGPGVVVGEGTELRGVNVSLEGPAGSCELEGPGSKGVVWARVEDAGSQSGGQRSNASGDSDSEDEMIDPRNTKFARLDGNVWLGATYPRAGINSPVSSSTSLSSLSSNESSSGTTQIQNIGSIGEVGATKDFLVECIRSLERAFREDHTVENASIELKTLRMASNVPQSEFRSVVLAQVCELVHRDPGRLKKWGPLIKTVSGKEEDLDDMEEVLLDLQGWCAEKIGTEDQVKFYSQMLQYFYNEDIVSEEGIIKWFKSGLSRRTGGSEGLKLREIGGKFLQMLMEADDGEDEESDED